MFNDCFNLNFASSANYSPFWRENTSATTSARGQVSVKRFDLQRLRERFHRVKQLFIS